MFSTIDDRFRFASIMRTINNGLPQNDVAALLGRPDDIQTEDSRSMTLPFGTVEMWCYGSDSHLGFPALGHLYFNNTKAVHFHNAPSMPSEDLPSLFSEDELRRLLRLIAIAPPPAYHAFFPQSLMRIVNHLQALGVRKAFAALSEYLRISPVYVIHDSQLGLFLLPRLLFDTPSPGDSLPELRIGQSLPLPPSEKSLAPRFPLLLHDDMPLLLAYGYTSMGPTPPLIEYLKQFFDAYSMRESPLVPTDRPFAIIDEIALSALSPWIQSSLRGFGMIVEQLLRTVQPVYSPARPDSFLGLSLDDIRPWLKRYDQESQSMGIHWDRIQNEYVLRTPKIPH